MKSVQRFVRRGAPVDADAGVLSRRDLLATACSTAAVMAVAQLPAAAAGAAVSSTTPAIRVTAAFLNGTYAGIVEARGGALSLLDLEGAATGAKAPSVRVRVEPLRLRVRYPIVRAMHDWLLDPRINAMELALISYDYDLREQRRVVYSNARAIDVVLDALDAASTSASVELEAIVESTSVKHSFGAGQAAIPPAAAAGKAPSANSFRLFIQGFESVLAQVIRVEPLVRRVRAPAAGLIVERTGVPSRLSFRMPMDVGGPIAAWFDEAAAGIPKPLPGVLQLLSRTTGEAIATVDLVDLVPARLTLFEGETGGRAIGTVELLARDMKFGLGKLIA